MCSRMLSKLHSIEYGDQQNTLPGHHTHLINTIPIMAQWPCVAMASISVSMCDSK